MKKTFWDFTTFKGEEIFVNYNYDMKKFVPKWYRDLYNEEFGQSPRSFVRNDLWYCSRNLLHFTKLWRYYLIFRLNKKWQEKNVFSTFCHVTNNSAINNKEWICYSPIYSLIFSIWYCTFYICTNVKDTHVLFSKKRWFAVRLQICIPT